MVNALRDELAKQYDEVKRLRGVAWEHGNRADEAEVEVERLRAALQRIKAECGRVCANFELCAHVACQSSVTAWMIADAALKGETPESANAKATSTSATPASCVVTPGALMTADPPTPRDEQSRAED